MMFSLIVANTCVSASKHQKVADTRQMLDIYTIQLPSSKSILIRY